MTTQSGNEPAGRRAPAWLTYEQVAAKLLYEIRDTFGLQSIEPKQIVEGHRSGTEYEIDAKGMAEGGQGFFIVECKRRGRSIEQGTVSDLAYRICDTRADGAILVSPMGFQACAEKIARAENIISVRLNQNATPEEFVMQFFDEMRIRNTARSYSSAYANPKLMRACASCGNKFPSEEHESLCSVCRAGARLV